MDAVAADHVITMTGAVLEPGWVGFEEGVITEVTEGEPPAELHALSLEGESVLLPGFVVPHVHLPLGRLRGVADDRPFLDWILRGILPGIEAETAVPGSFLEGARRSVAELVRAGVTTVGDNFLRADGVLAMREAGLAGLFFQEVFGSLADDEDEYIAGLERELDTLPEALEGQAFGYSPHTPWTCPLKTLQWITRRARRESRRLSIHLAESEEEHLFLKEATGPLHEMVERRGTLDRYRFGQSPTACLDEHGILGDDLLAVHCVQVDDDDVSRLARAGVHVVHCPTSNLKLAEGIAPVEAMLEAGVSLSLGLDSVASNPRLDPFAEMRLAILAQRGRYRGVGRLTAARALEMATAGGARALGLEDRTGRLEAGLSADLALIHVGGPHHHPVRDPVATVVWSAEPTDVRGVWIEGKARFVHPGEAAP